MDTSRQNFHHRWASIAAGAAAPSSGDSSPLLSLRFHTAATDGTSGSSRISRWLDTMSRVEAFTFAFNDLPRDSLRARTQPKAAEEPHLARWLRAQRVHETHARLCAYQQERLVTLPGFEWAPLLASWDDHLEELTAFLTRARKTPSRHSDDAVERALAVWHRNQKTLLREGRLASFKIQDMRHVEALTEQVRAGRRT